MATKKRRGIVAAVIGNGIFGFSFLFSKTALALTTQEGLISSAYAVTGARALRSASIVGVVIHMIAGILGLLIMAALAYLGDLELLSPFNILLYQLVWMIPGLLITEWTRSI